MNKKLIVRQNGYKDCGASCLLSIMRYYGCYASHEEVNFILKTNLEGTNAYNIINGSRSFGFDGYGIHYTYEEIINNSISFPIICHVLKNGMYHFIVIYEVRKNYLLVMDPASSNNKLSFNEFKKIYLNTSLVIYPIKIFKSSSDNKKFYEYLLFYFSNEKRNIIKVLVLGILEILFSLIFNYYLLICIDIILPNYKLSFLLYCSICFLTLSIFKNIFNYIKNKLINRIEYRISLNINNDIIRKFFNLPFNFFRNKSLGECISRINDIEVFNDYSSKIIVSLLTDTFLVLFSFLVLLLINYKLFLIFVIEIIFYFIITMIFKKKLLLLNENTLESSSDYNKALCEGINGFETNLNINSINSVIKNIEIKTIKYLRSKRHFNSVNYNQVFSKDIFNSIFYVLFIFISVIYINKDIISIGEFLLFNTVIFYFIDPLKNIIDIFLNIDYIKNIYNRLYDLIMVRGRRKSNNKCILDGNIVFDNVSYSMDGVNYLFKDVSFEIKKGSKFLIYGESGIGKSSIIKILLKYYEEFDGNIFIGKNNIKDLESEDILKYFTYVSQNGFINNDTLKNNIIYGRNIDEKRYEEVLDICNLLKLRDSKKLRNNFIIEDDGFNISGGERQKVILARSLLCNTDYLILDEALSEVSVCEEIEIIKKLFEIYKDKTIIYISHKNEIIDLFSDKFKLERR